MSDAAYLGRYRRNGDHVGYKIFVAISTGAQIANLPPILALANVHDRVLWMESQWAYEKAWSKGAIEVLNQRGLKQDTLLIDGDIDELASISDALISKLPNMVDNGCEGVCLVLNGGKKLTPIGLVLAIQKMSLPAHCEIKYLYGDDRPAQLKIHTNNILENQEIVKYPPDNMLKIHEIFQVNGLHVDWNKKWVWGNIVENERYGSDAKFTRLVHECYVRGFNQDDTEKYTTDWFAYKNWADDSKDTWQQEISKKMQRFDCVVKDPTELCESIAVSVRKFFPKTKQRELSNEEYADLAKDEWIKNNNNMPIGYRFELAVWRRTTRFLKEHPKYQSLVKECLLGVKVEKKGKQESELDVVLVLSNGIPIHLECKTWGFSKKDADARIQVLQQASSRLARMYTVAPMFPSMSHENWFKDMDDRFKRLKRTVGEKKVIAFTMPNPPLYYDIKVKKHSESCLSPDSFEESLSKILDTYLPKEALPHHEQNSERIPHPLGWG